MHTAYVYDMSVCESYRAGDRESSKISPLKNRYIQVDIRITVMNIHKEFRLNFPLQKFSRGLVYSIRLKNSVGITSENLIRPLFINFYIKLHYF